MAAALAAGERFQCTGRGTLCPHESLLKVLLGWAESCPATEDGWMFPSDPTNKPYYSTELQKRFLTKNQWELMRHASLHTTIDVNGRAMPESKRGANGKVVTMSLLLKAWT
jgi:hypothetical protein